MFKLILVLGLTLAHLARSILAVGERLVVVGATSVVVWRRSEKGFVLAPDSVVCFST